MYRFIITSCELSSITLGVLAKADVTFEVN